MGKRQDRLPVMRTADELVLIRKAKRRLMHALGWDEQAAYVAMRQAAMNGQRKLTDIARQILDSGVFAGENNGKAGSK